MAGPRVSGHLFAVKVTAAPTGKTMRMRMPCVLKRNADSALPSGASNYSTSSAIAMLAASSQMPTGMGLSKG